MTEEERVEFLVGRTDGIIFPTSGWLERMTTRYGCTVYGPAGQRYDWGQALAREVHGENPKRWPDNPIEEDISRAIRWEAGEWPGWVNRELTQQA